MGKGNWEVVGRGSYEIYDCITEGCSICIYMGTASTLATSEGKKKKKSTIDTAACSAEMRLPGGSSVASGGYKRSIGFAPGIITFALLELLAGQRRTSRQAIRTHTTKILTTLALARTIPARNRSLH